MVSAFRRYLQTLELLTTATSRDQKPRPSRGQKKQFLPWNPTPCKHCSFQIGPETPKKILRSEFSIPLPNSKHHQTGWDSFSTFWLGLNSLPGTCGMPNHDFCFFNWTLQIAVSIQNSKTISEWNSQVWFNMRANHSVCRTEVDKNCFLLQIFFWAGYAFRQG